MTLRLTLLFFLFALGAGPAAAAEGRDPYTHFFNANTGDLRAELADARGAGKKAIFILYEQEGCPGCIHMKTRVLNRPDVQTFYRQHFFSFAIDIHSAVPVTGFTGGNHTEKSFAQAQRVKGTPTLAFHDLDGQEIVRIVGPVREFSEFLLLGEFVASGAYRTRKFADYRQETHRKKGS